MTIDQVQEKFLLWNEEEFDDIEIQEVDDDSAKQQEERLLPDAEEVEGKYAGKKGILFSGRKLSISLALLAAILLLSTLVIFVKVAGTWLNSNHATKKDFHRSPDEYTLNPQWDFNAGPKTRKYHWTIKDVKVNPDGVFRPMLLINGQFPGPLIECNEGDTLVIEVDNQSTNSTSIHFHGIFQNGTNWMDGVVGVTQCPIAPARKFRYEFTINGQFGTYFYHGHLAAQIADGLFGPLVVHSKKEEKSQNIVYASDRVVMVHDYYHDLSSGLLRQSLSPGNEASPIPDGALINGLNKRDCSRLPHRKCDNSTSSLPSFELAPNENHRLRFINVGAFAWFQISIDEHPFYITEADATPILPYSDSSLMIAPAQRHSVIVNTNQTSRDSFWLRAKMATHCFSDPDQPGQGADTAKALIRYTSNTTPILVSSPVADPTSTPWSTLSQVACKDPPPSAYTPSIFIPPPSQAQHTYYLRTNIEIGDWRLERGYLNSSSFRPNLTSPTLQRTVLGHSQQDAPFLATQALNGVNAVAYDEKSEFLIQHDGPKVVDLIIQNFDEGNHPFHLHGHVFWVLEQGHGMFPSETVLSDASARSNSDRYRNTIRRDVATVEGFGYLVVRFIADNPGVWALHCHMVWHSEAGLGMLFVDRMDVVRTWTVPEGGRRLCEGDVEELEKGAAPNDDEWVGFGVGR